MARKRHIFWDDYIINFEMFRHPDYYALSELRRKSRSSKYTKAMQVILLCLGRDYTLVSES
jgi:hypothetical protein